MRLKKCPMCKMRIPGKLRECPICGTKYTKFQYFRMNILPKCLLIFLALLVVYNIIVIIVFNRTVRGYMDNPPKDAQKIERLISGYDNLSFIQKHFVNYSQIESVKKNFMDDEKVIEVKNKTCDVRFYDGIRSGVYTGEFYEDRPDGYGKFSYYLDDGTMCVYEGDFTKGEITGMGVMTFEDGTVYSGEFVGGVIDGNASVFNPDGYIVKKGEFVLGKMNGNATIYDNQGIEIYSGTFVSDIPTKGEYMSACKEATYAQIETDTDNYVNSNLKMSGVVTDVVVQEDMTVLYIISIAGNNHKNLCFEYIGEKSISVRQGDYVTFYGYCEGYRQFTGNSGETLGGMFIKTYYAE